MSNIYNIKWCSCGACRKRYRKRNGKWRSGKNERRKIAYRSRIKRLRKFKHSVNDEVINALPRWGYTD